MNKPPTTMDPGAAGALGRPQRSYAAQVVQGVIGRWSARVGLAWVAVMAFCAAFAPFIANSFPLLMKTERGIASPLLRALTPADVVIALAAVAAVVLLGFVRRVPFSHRFAALAWMIALLIPAASWDMVRTNWGRWVRALDSEAMLAFAVGTVGLIVAAVAIVIPLRVVLGYLAARREASGSADEPAPLWNGAVVRRFRFPLTVAATTVPLAILVAVLSYNFFSPPLAPVYDQYRQMHAAGQIDWAVYAPIRYSPSDRLRDQPQQRLLPPWWAPALAQAMPGDGAELSERQQRALESNHWLGTEENGADVFSRMIHASRIALAVGFIATGIAMIIGVTIGGIMGYFSGIVDLLGMRLVEIFEAIPVFFLLLTVVAFFNPNIYFLMVIIGLFTWVGFARFVRAEFLKLRRQDFVQAAVACAIPLRSILFRHMLPNGMAPALVAASFGVAAAILYESTLAFLGLVRVDEPSWGQMLSNAIGPAGGFSWWIAMFPGLAIFLTVFAYTLIGEALRDAIDPHLKKSAHL